MSNRNETAAYYRVRAMQLREIALAMVKDHCRETLILCAADYDYLAKQEGIQITLARGETTNNTQRQHCSRLHAAPG